MVQLTPLGKYTCNCSMRARTALAAANALPLGESCTPIPTAGLPFSRAEVA